MQIQAREIWTIGHSTRSLEEFLGLLATHGIKLLVDIRSFPGSRRYPHFNKENLADSLSERGIHYKHMAGLGGRRIPAKDSVNLAWRHPSFRGYADYMQTGEFKDHIVTLEKLAERERIAYMCSEALWWKCQMSPGAGVGLLKNPAMDSLAHHGKRKTDGAPFHKSCTAGAGPIIL